MKNGTTFNYILATIVTLFFMSFTMVNTTSQEWELEKNKDGIKVFTRMDTEDRFKEFKAVAELKSDMHSVLSKIKDIKSYSKWVNNCKEATLVEKVTNEELSYYMRLNTPWPISNRDIVVDLKILGQTPDRVFVELTKGKDGLNPAKEDAVRMPSFSGTWLLERTNIGVRVTHTGYADPGGTLPDWVINSGVVDGPIATIENLRSLLEG